jgi:tryptophan 2,3-dioxygenase
MLDGAMARPSLWDSFLRFLAAQGHPVPAADLERDVTAPVGESPGVQEVLLAIYRHDPLLAQMCERFVDLDEGLQEWRYRHVKMVERTIGTKRGTGGSAGAEYLRTTLLRPLFPDLWAIRVRL